MRFQVARHTALVTLFTCGWQISAWAAEPWVVVESAGPCEMAGEDLEAATSEAVLGRRAPDLSVNVILTGSAESQQAEVRIVSADATVGSKQLQASSCEELRGAVVAVVALAVSDVAPQSTEADTNRETGQPPRPAAANLALDESAATTDEGDPLEAADAVSGLSLAAPRSAFPEIDSPTTRPSAFGDIRGLFGVGTIMGLGDNHSVLVGGGLSKTTGRVQWRTAFWYGMWAASQEFDTDGASARYASQSGWATVDACLALESTRWWTLCGGADMPVVYSDYETRSATGEVSIGESLDVGLGATVSSLLTIPDLSISPELMTVARLPVVRLPRENADVELRATLGGAIAF